MGEATDVFVYGQDRKEKSGHWLLGGCGTFVCTSSLALNYPILTFQIWNLLAIFFSIVGILELCRRGRIEAPSRGAGIICLAYIGFAIPYTLGSGFGTSFSDLIEVGRYLLLATTTFLLSIFLVEALRHRGAVVMGAMLLGIPMVVGLEQALFVLDLVEQRVSVAYRDPLPSSLRISGTFQYPYAYALYLSFVVFLGVSMLARCRGVASFAIAVTGVGSSAALILLTGSRAAALLLIPVLFILPALANNGQRFSVLLALGVGGGAAAMTAAGWQDFAPIQRLLERGVDTETDLRFVTWRTLLAAWQESPLLGVRSEELPSAHNAFIYALAHGGILGLTLLLLTCYIILVLSFRHIVLFYQKVGEKGRHELLAVMHGTFGSGGIALLLYNLISTGFRFPFYVCLVALSFAVMDATGRMESERRSDKLYPLKRAKGSAGKQFP